MPKARPVTFEVRESKTPFHGKSWRVERTTGSGKETKREIHWFAKKEDADRTPVTVTCNSQPTALNCSCLH
jgi:hypothetical protein